MKPYLKLRSAIMAVDKKQDELAAAIAVSPSTFSKTVCPKLQFNFDRKFLRDVVQTTYIISIGIE